MNNIYIYMFIFILLHKKILEERKLKLLGHILRRDRNHPLHQATVSTTSALPRETEMRRVWRPRQFWTSNNMQTASEAIRNTDPSAPQNPCDRYNRGIRERIIEQAHIYQPPFHKGNGWRLHSSNSVWVTVSVNYSQCEISSMWRLLAIIGNLFSILSQVSVALGVYIF